MDWTVVGVPAGFWLPTARTSGGAPWMGSLDLAGWRSRAWFSRGKGGKLRGGRGEITGGVGRGRRRPEMCRSRRGSDSGVQRRSSSSRGSRSSSCVLGWRRRVQANVSTTSVWSAAAPWHGSSSSAGGVDGDGGDDMMQGVGRRRGWGKGQRGADV